MIRSLRLLGEQSEYQYLWGRSKKNVIKLILLLLLLLLSTEAGGEAGAGPGAPPACFQLSSISEVA